VYRALLSVFWAPESVFRALLSGYEALLSVYRALLSVCWAPVSVFRAPLSGYEALLSVYRALAIVHRALERVQGSFERA